MKSLISETFENVKEKKDPLITYIAGDNTKNNSL